MTPTYQDNNGQDSPYRREFMDALLLILEAIEDIVAAGHPRPILVGGAAVELWPGSEVVSGDFDFVTREGTAFEEALLERGFIRPSGPGVLTRGVHHPILQCGVEVVGNAPFDGRVSASNLRILIFRTGNLRLVSAEDVIADRMGQFASDPTSRRDMLQQAIMVY